MEPYYRPASFSPTCAALDDYRPSPGRAEAGLAWSVPSGADGPRRRRKWPEDVGLSAGMPDWSDPLPRIYGVLRWLSPLFTAPVVPADRFLATNSKCWCWSPFSTFHGDVGCFPCGRRRRLPGRDKPGLSCRGRLAVASAAACADSR